MSAEYADSIAEQIVDWIRQENTAQKDSLETFSLGLTDEGIVIRNAILGVLRPVISYHNCGAHLVIHSRFPRDILLKLANQALERMVVP